MLRTARNASSALGAGLVAFWPRSRKTFARAEKSSRPYPASLAAPRIWRTTPAVNNGVRALAAWTMTRSRSLAIRSVMNPGFQPFDAGPLDRPWGA